MSIQGAANKARLGNSNPYFLNDSRRSGRFSLAKVDLRQDKARRRSLPEMEQAFSPSTQTRYKPDQ
jgi:hypothetical protein